MSNLKNTESTQKVIFNEDLSRHIQGYGSELERIRTDVLAKLRSPELFKWQPGRPGSDNKTYYIQSYDIKKLIIIDLFKKDAEEFINFMSLLEHRPDYAEKEIKNILKCMFVTKIEILLVGVLALLKKKVKKLLQNVHCNT